MTYRILLGIVIRNTHFPSVETSDDEQTMNQKGRTEDNGNNNNAEIVDFNSLACLVEPLNHALNFGRVKNSTCDIQNV